MNSFITRRKKTPFYVWPIVISPFFIFGWTVGHFDAIDTLTNENGFYVCLFFLFLPGLLAYLWSKKYNLLSKKDMEIEMTDNGIYLRDGDTFKAFSWTDVHMLKIMEISTPAGYYKYLRLWTINYMNDRRHNTVRKYYTCHEIYFYGFDKKEAEVMRAYNTLKQAS